MVPVLEGKRLTVNVTFTFPVKTLKSGINLLIDNQFKKPQAFHETSTYRLGGTIIFLLFILVFLYLFIYRNIFFIEYALYCTSFFLLGFIDDLKINIAPKFRLLIMITFLVILVISNEIHINIGEI